MLDLLCLTSAYYKDSCYELLILCRHVVLDEADQMLERGFADSVEEILAASFKSYHCKEMHITLKFHHL